MTINQPKVGYVNITREHGIATIEFYHPQSNSLPSDVLDALSHAIKQEAVDSNTKVIVLRSAGEKVFCSGASFDELAAITNIEQGTSFFSGFANVINAMRKAPQLIIARIQGKCIGGGVGLAAAADYAIAYETAEVKLSELALGIGPFVIGPVVERKLGLSAYTQLAIDAALWRPADWARRKGLYSELHNEVAAMDESIVRLSTILSNYSVDAMKQLKHSFWQGTDHWDTLLKERAGISGKLILSDYSKNFIKKFKEKVAANA